MKAQDCRAPQTSFDEQKAETEKCLLWFIFISLGQQ